MHSGPLKLFLFNFLRKHGFYSKIKSSTFANEYTIYTLLLHFFRKTFAAFCRTLEIDGEWFCICIYCVRQIQDGQNCLLQLLWQGFTVNMLEEDWTPTQLHVNILFCCLSKSAYIVEMDHTLTAHKQKESRRCGRTLLVLWLKWGQGIEMEQRERNGPAEHQGCNIEPTRTTQQQTQMITPRFSLMLSWFAFCTVFF